MSYIGIDLGTTGCKCVVFGEDGGVLSQRYIEYGLIHDGGRIEQDAELWWALVRRAVAACAADCPDPKAVRALGVSSQGISFVPVDAGGKVLGNAISWLDGRAEAQTEALRREFGDGELFRRTGKRPSPCYTLPKLMWLRDERPDVYRKTWKFLMGLDFITYRLTGRAITDHSMAAGTMAYDISRMAWDDELIERCGLDAGKLPEIGTAGSAVGPILPDVAGELGLPGGTPVFLGAQDQKCAALGAGIGPGIATVSLGTATAVSTLCGRPVLDEAMRVPCFSLDGTRWVLESVVGTSGASLKWLRDTLFEGMSYPDMTQCAAGSPAGARGVLFYPHMQGATSPYWKSGAGGAFLGLSLASSRADIVRALLEGIAYQIAVNVDLHEEITGNAVRELRLFGGGAGSALWCGVIADVTGRAVTVPYTTETANLGAALLAGLAGGSAAGLPRPRETRGPDAGAHLRYGGLLREYLRRQAGILDPA